MNERILIEGGRSPFGWSRISDFFRCERLYRIRSKAPDTEVHDGPLARGSVGHCGLAHLYARIREEQHGRDPDAYYTPAEAMELYVTKHVVAASAWEPAVRAVLSHQPVAGRVLHVEEVFGAQVRYGPENIDEAGCPTQQQRRITARFDLVVERDGQTLIVDHKIVFKHGTDTADRYSLSGQFLLGRLIGQKTWRNFGGVVINALAAIPPFRGAQYKLEAAPGALATFPAALRTALERLDNCERTGVWLSAFHEQVCLSNYGRCSEFEKCLWEKEF
jgi:hypothetical protein